MTRLNWATLDRPYEFGVDRGVFYPPNGPGVPWNGLVSVSESPSDSNVRIRYQDGQTFGTQRTAGEFAGSIETYSYPPEFYKDVLSLRRPPRFNFSYRVKTHKAHHIHLVYNVLIGNGSINYGQQDVEIYTWDFTTRAISLPGFKPSAHLIINGDYAYPEAIAELEDFLYGSETESAQFPTPSEVFEIFEQNAMLRIIDHGDGSWTAIGPDEAIAMLSATEFEINWPSATYIDEETYTIRSL